MIAGSYIDGELFGSPEAMFKANWFLNYGESYMTETNGYWKNKYPKLVKKEFYTSHKWYARKPCKHCRS
jgi:hypothetical protein